MGKRALRRETSFCGCKKAKWVLSKAGVRGGKETGHGQSLSVIKVGRSRDTWDSESFVVPEITGIMDIIKSVLANSPRKFG